MLLGGILSGSLLFPEMVLCVAVRPYVLAQTVPCLGRGEPMSSSGKRGAQALVPVVGPPGIHHCSQVVPRLRLCLHAVQRAHAVLEFHAGDVFPRNHG